MKKAVVPGTFDPPTSGHLDIIHRASNIFSEVVVGVAASTGKNGHGPIFTSDERIELVRKSVAHLPNVTVDSFDNLLVEFAKSHGASVIVKGLRAVTDFEHEFQMAALNYRLDPDVETMFIMSAPEYMYLSSSAVKEIVRHGGSPSGLVPPQVESAVTSRLQGAI